jgi:hypothetical protein
MIRNQSLYPAELRDLTVLQRGNPYAGVSGLVKLAEQSGATRHSGARPRHNFGHIGGSR